MDVESSVAPATPSITPTDPTLTDAERRRLAPQAVAVLRTLERGPAWNYELATIGLSYTRRISDIRDHGFDVRILANGESGARCYGLTVLCPNCNGLGEHLVLRGQGCPRCNARGVLLVHPQGAADRVAPVRFGFRCVAHVDAVKGGAA